MGGSNDKRETPDQTEVIAVLVSGYDETGAQRATVILRDREGHVRMQHMNAHDEFARRAAQSDCFRRGKPVRDPVTGQVVRYELERVTLGH